MRISLEFQGQGEAAMRISGQTQAEKAILGFLAEGRGKRWMVSPSYDYRAGALTDLTLMVEQPPVAAEQGKE